MTNKGQLISDKLKTDLLTLKYEVGGNNILQRVQSFFSQSSMSSNDGLLIPHSNSENVEGGSAGNTQTTREYGYSLSVVEHLEGEQAEAQAENRYRRLMNKVDVLLDYLQKEPSNLNAWGATNDIAIYKIRVKQVRYNTFETKGGLAATATIIFSIFLNVIPQNL